jgi:hypothetical protein
MAFSNSPSTVLTELAKLSERVTVLEQQIQSSTAQSALPSTVLPFEAASANIETGDKVLGSVPLEDRKTAGETLGAVPGEVLIEATEPAGKALSTASSTVPMTPLSQASLAKRLGCSDKAIEKHRKLGSKESFAKWSCDRDPDSIAWTWEGGGGRGQPLRFTPHLRLERNV